MIKPVPEFTIIRGSNEPKRIDRYPSTMTTDKLGKSSGHPSDKPIKKTLGVKGTAGPANATNSSSSVSPSNPTKPLASVNKASEGRITYFLGVPRKNDPSVVEGLQKVYGRGRHRSLHACHQLGLRAHAPFSRRSREEIRRLEQVVTEDRPVESDLRRKEHEAVHRHRRRGTMRGIRMRLGLPVRGQRTKSNARTAKRLNRSRGA